MSENDEPANEATDEAKPKARRKPVYVCVPVRATAMAVFDDEGFEKTVYTVPKDAVLYAVSRCEGGKGQTDAVRAVLTEHEIDPTNYDGVMMFRADPIEFGISQQLIVRI